MTVKEKLEAQMKHEKAVSEAKKKAYNAVKDLRECLLDTYDDDDCKKLIKTLANTNDEIVRFVEAKKGVFLE